MSGRMGKDLGPFKASKLFKTLTGVDLVIPTCIDRLDCRVMFDSILSSLEHIRAGELRVLALISATCLEALPDIPTVGDFVPCYEASSWYGIGAPKKYPAEVLDRLNKEIIAALANPKMKARIADLGYTVFALHRFSWLRDRFGSNRDEPPRQPYVGSLSRSGQ